MKEKTTKAAESLEPPEDNRRIDGAVSRGLKIEILVDGVSVKAFEGESIAAALLASGRRTLRTTAASHEPRGMYCSIGACFDCVMIVDGRPNVRTCQTPVRAGMQIESQEGVDLWKLES